jgi:phosphoglycolate phosphatase
MARTRLVVFDLDGTLINSSLDLCNSVNAALDHVGKSQLPNEIIAGYIGDGAAMLMRRALGDPGDADSGRHKAEGEVLFERAFQHFLEHYREHKLDNTRCYDGVLEALATIRARRPKLPMAVLTNKPVLPSRGICDALGLTPYFFQNYGGNSFATKKPDPEGLLKLIEEAQAILLHEDHAAGVIDPADVAMVGDSDVDVLTARRIGARSIGCGFGLAPASRQLAKPDVLVMSPNEWVGALGI